MGFEPTRWLFTAYTISNPRTYVLACPSPSGNSLIYAGFGIFDKLAFLLRTSLY